MSFYPSRGFTRSETQPRLFHASNAKKISRKAVGFFPFGGLAASREILIHGLSSLATSEAFEKALVGSGKGFVAGGVAGE